MTQSIDQLHLLILNVGLAIHNADWNWRNVNSPFTRLYYVTEGAARILLPTGIQELKPDHLYLVPSFTTHSYLCDTHFVHYYLHINDDRIQKVLSYIRKNIYKTIDIDSLAAISCLSKDHFIRLFKKEINNTPLQYINQKKIEKAQLILITDSMPVKNISYLLAYEDHSYFNRLFKKLTGVTPQQYRDRYKK